MTKFKTGEVRARRPGDELPFSSMVHPPMSPTLAAAVERAKVEGRASGELRTAPASPVESPFDPAEREVIAAWHSSGEYERIVVNIVAGDPEIATP